MTPRFYVAAPLASVALTIVAFASPAWVIGALITSVFCAVHHAEVIAHKLGEPFGTLILALAVTVIEVALIVSMMTSGRDAATLPRDTVFAAIMIICGGVIGLCIMVGAWQHHEQTFRFEGVNAGLATLMTLAALTLVLPQFTTSTAGPTYTDGQLAFAALASLVLWSIFVFMQTVRHRDYFLPQPGAAEGEHAPAPSAKVTWMSAALLVVALVSVVGLAKALSPTIEAALDGLGVPKAVLGIVIAMVVLLPESVAAVRAARMNRLQTSMNLAIGSALATIGLTIPAVAVASRLLNIELQLGLDAKSMALLVFTFLVSSVTLASGRTNVLQGAVHLVIFAAFLFLTAVP